MVICPMSVPAHFTVSRPWPEALLASMQANIDNLCAERDRLKTQEPSPVKGKSSAVGDAND
jgi:hypothetical protein